MEYAAVFLQLGHPKNVARSVNNIAKMSVADALTWMMESVRGSVMTLRSSGEFSPLWMWKESMMSLVSLYRNPEATSKGSRTRTDSQLKKSWTVAPPNALYGVRGHF